MLALTAGQRPTTGSPDWPLRQESGVDVQVRCERITDCFGVDQGDRTSTLVRGAHYVVLAVYAGSRPSTSLQVLSESDDPIVVGLKDFSFVDRSVPSGWQVFLGNSDSIVVTQPPLGDSMFWDDYFDGKFGAIAAYEQVLSDILARDRSTSEPSAAGLRHRPAEIRPVLRSIDLEPGFIASRLHLTLVELSVGRSFGWITAAEAVEVLERQLLKGVEVAEECLELATLPRWNEPAITAILDSVDVTAWERGQHCRAWFHLALEQFVENRPTRQGAVDFIERFFVTTGYPRWMNDFIPAMLGEGSAADDKAAENLGRVRAEFWRIRRVPE